MYKLFTNTDVVDNYLKKYVIGFGDYTPPLRSIFIDALPHPVPTIAITGATAPMLCNHLTAGQYPNLVRYLLNTIGRVRYTMVGM